MKRILSIVSILSWINIIVGGIFVLGGIVLLLMAPQAESLIGVVLTGAIVLHSYAAMQLRKSMLNPQIPLPNQTSVGIRFIGFLALFLGVINIASGTMILTNGNEYINQLKMPVEMKGVDIKPVIRVACVFTILIGVSVVVNVMLSQSLLRVYKASQNKDSRQQ